MVRSSIVRSGAFCLLAFLASASPRGAAAREVVPGPPLRFEADTLDFANQTVYLYPHGYAEKRILRPGEKPPAFTLRCFAMCRTVEQFRKFARFDPARPISDDAALTALIRRVTHRAVWRGALATERRVVIPGYANLRALSKARPLIMQESVGGGWTTYLRPGNYRMFHYWWNGPGQQARTQRTVEEMLARNDVFVAYLNTFPSLSVNHAVVLYGHGPATREDAVRGTVHYLTYDPNHPEAPRDMVYDTRQRMFSYQKDWDFVGGKVTVLQVYGAPIQ